MHRQARRIFRNGYLIKNTALFIKLLPSITYQFGVQKQSSRQIDLKIKQQRWKNIQSNFKSLKTSFGLKVPLNVSQNYSRPSKVQYNLQHLRQCSNIYPEYLLQQLKNSESKFFQVIQKQLEKLWAAQQRQALQFISFTLVWKLYNKDPQIQTIIVRAIKKAELNMGQIFETLRLFMTIEQQDSQTKKQQFQKNNQNSQIFVQKLDFIHKQLLIVLQNKIINRLQLMQPNEYQALFKIVNLFRYFDIYPQNTRSNEQNYQIQNFNFFQIIERSLLSNIRSIPPSSLVIMAVHYANNAKEDQIQRLKILQSIQDKITLNLKFLKHQQIFALIYCYIRNSLLTPKLASAITERIKLTYNQMDWTQKKQILALCSSFPDHQRSILIAEGQSQILKGKPVVTNMEDGTVKKQYDSKVYVELDYQIIPDIYLASFQANQLTDQLIKSMQKSILNNIYNYGVEDVVKSVWLFTVTPNIDNNLERIHKKLEVIIQGGFQGGQYSIKDVSMIVWSMCNCSNNNQNIYKQSAKFWDNIEFYLQQKLEKSKDSQNSFINQSFILWSYTFNKPLKFKTVSLITDCILNKFDSNDTIQIYPFEFINILTFYCSLSSIGFPQAITQRVKYHCFKIFQQKYGQMNYIELMKCLKYLATNQQDSLFQKLSIKQKTWENIIDILNDQLQNVEYKYIMAIVGLVVNSPLGKKQHIKCVKLVDKLIKKKKYYQQIKSAKQLKT